MKNILLITLGAIVAVSAIVFGFTFNQVNEERLNLSADLQYRTRLLADSLAESVGPNFLQNSTTTLQRIVDRFTDKERIVGIAVFTNRGVPLAASKEMPKRVTDNPDFVFAALDKGEPTGLFETLAGAPLYLHVSPLFAKSSSVSGALVVVQNASYIDTALVNIWKRNAVRLLVQIVVFSAAIVLLVRFALLRVMRRFAESVKSARMSKTPKAAFGGPFFLKPLASEIMKMNQSLAQARFAASEEARMRLLKLDSPWTAERLKEFIKANLKNRKVIVVSNREPYIHSKGKNGISVSVPASGMVTALEPLVEACAGEWLRSDYDKMRSGILAEIKDVPEPIILVQDFHLALLPEMVKKSRPDAAAGLFWHIPWPSPEHFSICPWRKEILLGMLGADLIGFHTQQYCNNFIDTVGKEVESLIDLEQFAITHDEHKTLIKPFPISIAFATEEGLGEEKEPDRKILRSFGVHTPLVGLGVDRLDYTKGILERFKGIEHFLLKYPEYKEKLTFLQIAPPSREEAKKYREYSEAVSAEAERINEQCGTRQWKPIALHKKHYPHLTLNQLYRLANVCLVTSVHDGMNLVAKEFAAARNDELGVLVLSNFTGASRDLKGALLVNPYSAEETSEALHMALTMPKTEQRRRMRQMRETVRSYNVYRWAAEFIRALIGLG